MKLPIDRPTHAHSLYQFVKTALRDEWIIHYKWNSFLEKASNVQNNTKTSKYQKKKGHIGGKNYKNTIEILKD